MYLVTLKFSLNSLFSGRFWSMTRKHFLHEVTDSENGRGWVYDYSNFVSCSDKTYSHRAGVNCINITIEHEVKVLVYQICL